MAIKMPAIHIAWRSKVRDPFAAIICLDTGIYEYISTLRVQPVLLLNTIKIVKISLTLVFVTVICNIRLSLV